MATYTSYLSNILTHTTSRYNHLRKILLNNEDDGDTEDDTHIARVLRAYYTEKGRPFPPWLPPDPNDRRAITPQPVPQQQNSYFGSSRNLYGNPHQQQQQQQQRPPPPSSSASGRGILNDLWDSPAATSAPTQSQSLRSGRRQPGGSRPESNSSLLNTPQARPLPSQRTGSYQSTQQSSLAATGFAMDPNPSPGAGTAQDRLKARLWGRNGSGNLPPPQSSSYGQQEPSGGHNGSDRRFGRIS